MPAPKPLVAVSLLSLFVGVGVELRAAPLDLNALERHQSLPGTFECTASSNIEWLWNEVGQFSLEDMTLFLKPAPAFEEPTKQARLESIVREAHEKVVPLEKQEQRAAVVAASLLVRSHYPEAENVMIALLRTSDNELKAAGRQGLAVLGTASARNVLESTAKQKVAQLSSIDGSQQYEAYDLFRCSLIAAPKEERAQVMERLIDSMKAALGQGTPEAVQFEAELRKGKLQIDAGFAKLPIERRR